MEEIRKCHDREECKPHLLKGRMGSDKETKTAMMKILLIITEIDFDYRNQ